MMKYSALFSLFLCLLILVGCSKDEDDDGPMGVGAPYFFNIDIAGHSLSGEFNDIPTSMDLSTLETSFDSVLNTHQIKFFFVKDCAVEHPNCFQAIVSVFQEDLEARTYTSRKNDNGSIGFTVATIKGALIDEVFSSVHIITPTEFVWPEYKLNLTNVGIPNNSGSADAENVIEGNFSGELFIPSTDSTTTLSGSFKIPRLH